MPDAFIRNTISEFRRCLRAWNSGVASWRDLEFIFGSNNGYPQVSALESVDAILSLGRRKWVPATLVKLESPKAKVRTEFERLLGRHRYYGADHNQEPEKLEALHWLMNRGAQRLAAEGDYIAGRYDVAAEDLRVVVECGTTRLDKLLTTAMSDDWGEFVLVPRGLGLAVVFTLTQRPFDRIRPFGAQALDRAQFLERICQEPRVTTAALHRCLNETNEVFRKKYRQIAAILDKRVSPICSFF